MNLFVDIGNSAVKWVTTDELLSDAVHRATSEDLPGSVTSVWQQIVVPGQVYISSVLKDDRITELGRWISRRWNLSPVIAQTKAEELGVINGYRTPEQLGVDRWLALLAARSLSAAPVVVVDCGSATTIDLMDAMGRHLGGVILPGLQLFQHCLLANTDIPPVAESGTIDYFATDTAIGITSGAMLATASSVERMLRLLQERSGSPVDCLLTGGNAILLSEHLTQPHRNVPNLILQGLALQAGRQD
jgi:type III pantothenate kinase